MIGENKAKQYDSFHFLDSCMNENEIVNIHPELMSVMKEHCDSRKADFKNYFSEYPTKNCDLLFFFSFLC